MSTTHARPELRPNLEPDAGRTDATSTFAARSLAALRIAFGLTFLWAFFDKLFGLGYATPEERAWINGGDPTAGFLKGSEGPFDSFYHSLVGDWWVSPLFMIGLAGIGLALTLGIGMRIAAGCRHAAVPDDVERRPAAGEQPGARRPHPGRADADRAGRDRRRQHLGLRPDVVRVVDRPPVQLPALTHSMVEEDDDEQDDRGRRRRRLMA